MIDGATLAAIDLAVGALLDRVLPDWRTRRRMDERTFRRVMNAEVRAWGWSRRRSRYPRRCRRHGYPTALAFARRARGRGGAAAGRERAEAERPGQGA